MKAWERWMDKAEVCTAEADHELALEALERAGDTAEDDGERFEALLAKARVQAVGLGDAEAALASYESARELARDRKLDRAAEAELGAGSCLLQLGRAAEGRTVLARAAASFRRQGDALRRGCALLLLAEESAAAGDEHRAERDACVAGDLLLAAGEPRLLSAALSLQSELASQDGRPDEARTLLERARTLAAEIADETARRDLRARRREILRTWTASGVVL